MAIQFFHHHLLQRLSFPHCLGILVRKHIIICTRVYFWALYSIALCIHLYAAAAAAKSLQSCPTLCDPIDGSPPGSPVLGIFQARTLEWVSIAFSNAGKWKVKVKSFSRVQLFATPWTAAYQAPLPMGVSRQAYWSGLPLPSLVPHYFDYFSHVVSCTVRRKRSSSLVCLFLIILSSRSESLEVLMNFRMAFSIFVKTKAYNWDFDLLFSH